jgi:hypothetical protein
MVITRLKGGMGNQMFQYALGLHMAEKLQTELYLDLSSLLDRSKGDFVYRNYDLTIFKLEGQFVHSLGLLTFLSKFKSSSITKFFRKKVEKNKFLLKEKAFKFEPRFLETKGDKDILIEGWFQSGRYFSDIEDKIRAEFSFVHPIISSSVDLHISISNSNAICLNVRRTDFLKVDNLNTTNREYFFKAADLMANQIENPKFFIFSDDTAWCRQELKLPYDHEVVGHEHKGVKFGNYMQLMIACKHFIIPNSSYAWWAVWLNKYKDKKVIAPKNWFTDTTIDTSDLIPDSWMRL